MIALVSTAFPPSVTPALVPVIKQLFGWLVNELSRCLLASLFWVLALDTARHTPTGAGKGRRQPRCSAAHSGKACAPCRAVWVRRYLPRTYVCLAHTCMVAGLVSNGVWQPTPHARGVSERPVSSQLLFILFVLDAWPPFASPRVAL